MVEQLTNLQASLNILKFTIGLGVLGLPHATKKIGWLPSLLGLPVMALMNVYGIIYAVKAKQKYEAMQDKRSEKGTSRGDESTYLLDGEQSPNGKKGESGLGFFDHLVGCVLGSPAQALCAGCILLGQILTGVAYVRVITESWAHLAKDDSPSAHRVYSMVLTVVLCSLTVAKSLRNIAFISGLGLLTCLWIIGLLMYESAEKLADGSLGTSVRAFAEKPSFSAWYGVTGFAFANFPVAIEVFGEMKDKSSFVMVMGLCQTLVCSLYIAVGSLGYLCYGPVTKDFVLFNFPESTFVSISASVSLSAVLIFSFPVQMHPVYSCVQHFFEDRIHYVVLRCVMVCATVLVSSLFHETAYAMQVAGAICFGIPCLILPVVVYMVLERRPHLLDAALACAILLTGAYGCIACFL